MTDSIRLDSSAPIAEIVIDHPEKRNALSVEMWASIPDLVDRAESDPKTKVLIIHGGRSGAFAAGADISEFKEVYATKETAKVSLETIAAALNAVEYCTKPTIAAIEGACVGGGVSLAMACDLRVADNQSKFGITPGKLGLAYPIGDTRRLLQAIGPGAAKDLLFTGRIVDADDARKMNLIDHLVASGTALESARTLAQEIASNSQWSIRAMKKVIQGLQSGWQDSDAEAADLILSGFFNEDFVEGYTAFLEKRSAKFTFK